MVKMMISKQRLKGGGGVSCPDRGMTPRKDPAAGVITRLRGFREVSVYTRCPDRIITRAAFPSTNNLVLVDA